MDIEIDISRSANENAQRYFESSKKAKRKLKGAAEAVEKLSSENGMDSVQKRVKRQKREEKKQLWFQKYRWFHTSSGNLAIGGKDAQTNEDIIKKHTESNDVVFHTEIAGSPFFVLKREIKKKGSSPKESPDEESDKEAQELQEIANATASFSKAWQAGASSADAYYVNPDQVSKSARAGEYLTKGSFMIYGKKSYLHAELRLFARIENIKGGLYISITPIRKSDCFAEITPGGQKSSDAAKRILEYLREKGRKEISIEEVQAALPPGDCTIRFIV